MADLLEIGYAHQAQSIYLHLRDLDDDIYDVEETACGRIISIQKPGNIPRTHGIDILVSSRCEHTGEVIERIEFEDILAELDVICVQPDYRYDIYNSIMDIFRGYEPKTKGIRNQGGRSPEYLLKTIKWLFIAEDSAYPPEKGFEGRGLFGKVLEAYFQKQLTPVLRAQISTPGFRSHMLNGLGLDFSLMDRVKQGQELDAKNHAWLKEREREDAIKAERERIKSITGDTDEELDKWWKPDF